jgi:hypothetical protein
MKAALRFSSANPDTVEVVVRKLREKVPIAMELEEHPNSTFVLYLKEDKPKLGEARELLEPVIKVWKEFFPNLAVEKCYKVFPWESFMTGEDLAVSWDELRHAWMEDKKKV